jgi:single-strand DNA-binding protein
MGDVNRATLLGRLGADAELRGEGDHAKLSMRVATSQKWRDKSGQDKEATQWNTCVLWGKRASAVAKYLTKGTRIYVEGRVETRSYDDKDGVKRYATEIVVSELDWSSRDGSQQSKPPAYGGDRTAFGGAKKTSHDREEIPSGGFDGGGAGGDDDIPFAPLDERLF